MRTGRSLAAACAGVALAAALPAAAQAQQTFPPDTKLLVTADAGSGPDARGLVTMQTAVGSFTTVRMSVTSGARFVLPRAAWGRKVGTISVQAKGALSLTLPRRPRGTVVLRPTRPRVELVPVRGSYDLRLSRFPTRASDVSIEFASRAGSLLRLSCPGTFAFRVVALRTAESPAVETSSTPCG